MGDVETWDGPFHKRSIVKGDYGTLGKIYEEIEEAVDAIEQGQYLMALIECGDILGACAGLLMNGGRTSEQDAYADLIRREGTVYSLAELYEKRYVFSIGDVVSSILDFSSTYKMGFADLKDYAILRSSVARHAIKKAEESD